MRCATHANALKSVFEGRAHPLTGPTILAAKIGITQEVLNDYLNLLSNDPGFQAWFAAAQQENRLSLKLSSDAPVNVRALPSPSLEYGVASYFSGGQLYTDVTCAPLIDSNALLTLGFTISDVADPMPPNVSGDNPVHSIALQNRGTENFEVLDRFILSEDKIIIYDKYINDSALDLISHISSKLSPGSELHVRTSDIQTTCKKPAEILARIAASNSQITYSCKNVSIKCRKKTYDRYIFFGNRLQAVFTAGLDCFGLKNAAGARENKQSKINIYAIDARVKLEFEAKDGSILSTYCVSET